MDAARTDGGGVDVGRSGPRCSARSSDHPQSAPPRLSIRAGIHTGEIKLIGDDIAGIAVHIVSRVSSLAASDEVLVSSTVRGPDRGIGQTSDAWSAEGRQNSRTILLPRLPSAATAGRRPQLSIEAPSLPSSGSTGATDPAGDEMSRPPAEVRGLCVLPCRAAQIPHHSPREETLLVHPRAKLTLLGRLLLVHRIQEEAWAGIGYSKSSPKSGLL